jgi:hypothetical protein
MQSVHADQQDVVNIGRIGGRAKGHPGQQAERDFLQYHSNILPDDLLRRTALINLAARYFTAMTGS